MYLEFFGLREFPFSLAPDPRYLYLSVQHQEALAHLLYGVRSEGGFVQLTGEVGTGKTTVGRCFLEQLPPRTKAAVILNPRLTPEELLDSVCGEFEIPDASGDRGRRAVLDRIGAFLIAEHAAGRRAVLLVDEAQNLDAGVLEQLRLLTNLETSRHKLLQIILMGQPELRATLARPELRQLAQRITARFHLGPLSREDTGAYVRHRLQVAGCSEPLFPAAVVPLLRRLSGGVPRMINILCDRALLGAFVQGKRTVDRGTLRQAAREVSGEGALPRLLRAGRQPLVLAGVASLCAALVAAGYLARPRPGPAGPAVSRPVAAAPAVRAKDPLQVLLELPEAADEAAAARALFAPWGITYEAGGGDVCAQARSRGLACLSGQGGLDLLRRLNRPALLRFLDDEGRERRVALTGATEGGLVRLAAGGRSATVDLRWYGGYTLLWKAPPGTSGVIAPGAGGPAVRWLAARLSRALGRGGAARPDPVYDEGMTELVREFQRSAGLPEDGIAGPQTLLLLDAGDEPGTPTLAMR
jgi:general secretion pathway protein A